METAEAVSERLTIKGCCNYTIKGYSGYCGVPGTDLKTSFSLCGVNWALYIFPSGHEDWPDHFGFALKCLDNKTVRARFKLSAISRQGLQQVTAFPKQFVEFCSCKRIGLLYLFHANLTDTPYYGSLRACLVKDAAEKFVIDDQMQLSVDIEVYRDVHRAYIDDVKLGPCLARAYSANFSSSALFHDVTFRFADSATTIPAHKFILASRSEVFQAMFTSGMQEDINGDVLIDDCDVSVMKALVHFLYTDSLEGFGAVSKEDLLVAAAKYAVPGLLRLCDAALCLRITSENAIRLYRLAQSCGAVLLRHDALRYISTHSECVVDLLDSPSSPFSKAADADANEEEVDADVEIINAPPRKSQRREREASAEAGPRRASSKRRRLRWRPLS